MQRSFLTISAGADLARSMVDALAMRIAVIVVGMSVDAVFAMADKGADNSSCRALYSPAVPFGMKFFEREYTKRFGCIF